MRYHAIDAVSTAASITSHVVDMQFTFVMSAQFNWDGTTNGTIYVQGSDDLVNWTTLPNSTSTANGTPGSFLYEPGILNGVLWTRLKFDRTSGSGTMNGWIGGKEEIGAGSDTSNLLSILNLENKYVRTARFVLISSGTSGTVTLPAYSTVVLNDFGGTVDAVVSDASGGRPTETHVLNGLGNPVATTFDSSGNYSFDSTPVSYPVTLIYRVQQRLRDFDSDSLDIVGGVEITDISIQPYDFGVIAVPNGTNPVADTTSDTLTLTSSGSTITITGNSATDTVNFDFRDSVGLSVVGRASNTTGVVADIVAGTDGHVLRRSGATVGFGTIPSTSVTGILSFVTIDCPAGTDPVADSAADTLTLTRTEQTITITGNAVSDTINFHVPGAVVHPIDPSNNFPYDKIPVGLAAGASGNTGVGSGVLTALTTGQFNIAYGGDCLAALTTGGTNLAVGVNNLSSITIQSGFMGIGFSVYSGTDSGTQAFGIGNGIGSGSWIPGNAIQIGSVICNQPLANPANISDSITIGTQILTGGGSPSIASLFAIGQQLFTADDAIVNSGVAIGTSLGNGSSGSYTNAMMLGFSMFDGASNNVSSTISIGQNIFVGGTHAYQGSTTLLIGSSIGGSSSNAYSGSNNLFLGIDICKFVENPSECVVFGTGAATNLLDGIGHIIIGNDTGTGIQGGTFSVALGPRTMQNVANPNQSVAIGRGAFQGATTLSESIAIGPNAFQNPTSISSSVGIGSAVFGNSPGSALDRCYSFGSNTGPSCDTNINIILLGSLTDASSSSSTNEMCVGSEADPITKYWWGNGGAGSATPDNIIHTASNAVGTNIAGATYTVQGGAATGNAVGGSFFIDTSVAGAGGTTTQSFAHGVEVDNFQRTKTYGGRIHATRVVTAAGAITVTVADDWVVVKKTTGAATTVNLPASPATGTEFTITDGKFDAATNNITITPAAGNINNAATFVMNVNGQSATIRYDGAQWLVV